MNFKTFIKTFKYRSKTEGAKDASSVSSSARTGAGIIDLMPQANAMCVPTVFRCVDVLTGSVSSLPMIYEVKKGGVYEADTSTMLNYLLNVEPCEWMCAPDFKRLIVQDMVLEGNAYIVPMRNPVTHKLWRLVRVNPKYVQHDTKLDSYKIFDIETGINDTFDESDILHIKNFTLDGKTGISTLTYARISTETAASGEIETLSRFKNGGNVRGIVSNDGSGIHGFGEYQDSELEKTATSLDEKFRSGEKIVSIPGTAQFNPITLSSQDMQFLESRKFNGLDICRFFNVPPQFVFYDTASNYKSAEMANVAFLTNTLNPLLKKIEAEFRRKLIPMMDAARCRIRFDREELYSCDLQSQTNYIKGSIESGTSTINEWRTKMNKKPIDGGDKLLVSANLKSIDEMNAATDDNKGKLKADSNEQE